MKKRLLISFTLICFTNSFAVLVELTQAFEYAKNSGVQEKNFDAIKKEFEQNATQEKKIDNIKMQEIVSKFLAAQVKKEGEQKFDTYFDEQFKKIEQLKKESSKLQQERKDPINIIKQISQKEDELKKALEIRSANKWFYTGDLLWKWLKLKGVDVIDTPYGKGIAIPEAIKKQIKNSLVQLVSHNQIYATCGFNTVANAYAFEKQARANKKINFQETRAIAQRFFVEILTQQPAFKKCITGKKFEEPELYQLILLVQNNPNIFGKNFQLLAISDPSLNQNGKSAIKNTIINNKITHFIFHTGGHFSLASILKEGNDKYSIYFISSTNSSIRLEYEGQYLHLLDTIIEQAKQSIKPKITEKGKMIHEAITLIQQRKFEDLKKDLASNNDVWIKIFSQQGYNSLLSELLIMQKREKIINNAINFVQQRKFEDLKKDLESNNDVWIKILTQEKYNDLMTQLLLLQEGLIQQKDVIEIFKDAKSNIIKDIITRFKSI